MADTDSTTEAFAAHDAYDRNSEGFSLSTTPFDARVAGENSQYRVCVTVPTLGGATEDTVEEVVENGWFETFCLRLEDASGATRADVTVPEPAVKRDDDTVVIEFEFTHDDPARAAEAAKTLAEYVEGTYVEGIVPGYSYLPPVAGLLSRARQQGDGEGERGPMPL